MQKLKQLFLKYYEQISYLFFGGLATLLNFVLLNIFQALGGLAFAAGVGNVLNNALCILFAYWTNRTFVFRSQNHGKAAWKEFGQFLFFRLVTLVLDQVIIMAGVRLVGPWLGFAVEDAGAGGALTPSALWAMGVKLFSQVVVILSNYVFSKLFTFKKK